MRVLGGQNIYVRVALMALLALFFIICGLHLAGAHHDFDSDGLVVIDAISAVMLAVAAWSLRPRRARLNSGPSHSIDIGLFSRWGPLLPARSCFTVQLR